MLSSYIELNGPDARESFPPYIHGPTGFFTLWDATHGSKTYGNDLDFLLYGFYVAGRFDGHMPSKITLGRFTPSSRSIRIEVPVTRGDFHECTDRERRLFIAHSVELGVELVATRHSTKRDTDFQRLVRDVSETSQRYLSREPTKA